MLRRNLMKEWLLTKSLCHMHRLNCMSERHVILLAQVNCKAKHAIEQLTKEERVQLQLVGSFRFQESQELANRYAYNKAFCVRHMSP